MKINHIWGWELQDSHKETPDQSDVNTVPNEALTVREIMDRFTKGTLPNIARPSFFSDDNVDYDAVDMSELLRLDLTEIDEVKANLADHIDKLKKDLADQKRSQADNKEKVAKALALYQRAEEAQQAQETPDEQ